MGSSTLYTDIITNDSKKQLQIEMFPVKSLASGVVAS